MMNTQFCLTPRGDCLYSVRFAEVLSSGCIPIIYADGWVLPYNRDIVDWTKLAVLLPQRQAFTTKAILQNITKETRCQMRKDALQFSNDYLKDSHAGRLRAILEIVDARISDQTTATAFSAAPGNVAYDLVVRCIIHEKRSICDTVAILNKPTQFFKAFSPEDPQCCL